jgi:hypothetical protein
MSTLRKLCFSITAAVVLCCASVMTAQAVTVTFATRAAFNAATTGTTTVNFNGVAPPNSFVQLPSFNSAGVTFTPGAESLLFIIDTGVDPIFRFAGASGGVLAVQAGTTKTLNIALGGSFTAVGFDVGNNSNGTDLLTITATLSNGDVTTFTTTRAGNFFGFTTTPAIVSLRLTSTASVFSAGFNIDNFTFGQASGGGGGGPAPVPEPATMLLLGTGLAGVGATVRKRRKAITKA